jgi:hypothetical protein
MGHTLAIRILSICMPQTPLDVAASRHVMGRTTMEFIHHTTSQCWPCINTTCRATTRRRPQPSPRPLHFFLLFVLLLILNKVAVHAQMIVNLTSGNGNAMSFVSFCHQCPDPTREGSIVKALNSKFGPQRYSVSGELVYCVPNHGEKPRVLNAHQFSERVVFVERGKVSLLQKALRIQSQSEAVAIIVADDGSCDEEFWSCGPRAGSLVEGGFAAHDDDHLWKAIEIPVVVVTASSAERLRTMMGVKKIYVNGSGEQNITAAIGDGHQRKRHNEL